MSSPERRLGCSSLFEMSLTSPISRAELLDNPILSGMQILKAPQANEGCYLVGPLGRPPLLGF